MNVLVSGGGIAGPALAWFLAKTGAQITILEKAPKILPYGQNIDLQGSAIEVVKKMGLMGEVRKHNTTETGTQFIDPKGRPFAAFPVVKGSQASFTSEFEILRGDLAKVFWEATRDLPNVTWLFGTVVNKVISNDDESVKVELSNGEVKEYDLLVAADGQWSKIRKQCFPPESVEVVDKGLYAVYWTMPRIASDNNWWNVYIGLESKILTIRPDPYGTVRACFTHMPLNDAQKKAWATASRSDKRTQAELLKEEFATVGWQGQRLLESMDTAPDFYFQAIQQIKLSKWSNSRVVCLGDAAYCPSPLTGQGTSLAILGAYVLGGELSKLKKGEHPAKALEAYDTVFRPSVEKLQRLPWFVPDVAHPKTPIKRWLLNTFVWWISIAAAGIVKIRQWRKNNDWANFKDDTFPLPRYPGIYGEGAEERDTETAGIPSGKAKTE